MPSSADRCHASDKTTQRVWQIPCDVHLLAKTARPRDPLKLRWLCVAGVSPGTWRGGAQQWTAHAVSQYTTLSSLLLVRCIHWTSQGGIWRRICWESPFGSNFFCTHPTFKRAREVEEAAHLLPPARPGQSRALPQTLTAWDCIVPNTAKPSSSEVTIKALNFV